MKLPSFRSLFNRRQDNAQQSAADITASARRSQRQVKHAGDTHRNTGMDKHLQGSTTTISFKRSIGQ
jgi:hypothetical protein